MYGYGMGRHFSKFEFEFEFCCTVISRFPLEPNNLRPRAVRRRNPGCVQSSASGCTSGEAETSQNVNISILTAASDLEIVKSENWKYLSYPGGLGNIWSESTAVSCSKLVP